MSRVRRVITGASGSPSSLQVLRSPSTWRATSMPPWCPFCPGCRPMVTWPIGALPTPPVGPRPRQRLQDALNLAWGDLPADLPVRPVIRRGQPGPVLVDVACRPGDLLVVGAGRRGALARIAGGRVSRYRLADARCPVLTIPPPPLARKRAVERWPGRSGTGR